MIASPVHLTAVIAAAAAAAFILERRVTWLARVGASLLAIAFGALLSNTGLVPPASPVYDVVGGGVTSLAIAWLLLAVRLSDLREAGRPVLAAFALALGGTALGALVGAMLFAPVFGGDTWRLAGTLTGTYAGGSLNFAAVGRELGLSGGLFAGTAAADNVTTALWLGVVLLVPVWLGRFYPTPVPGEGAEEVEGAGTDTAEGWPGGTPGAAEVEEGSGAPEGRGAAETSHPDASHPETSHPFFGRVRLSTLDLAFLLAVGLALLAVSEWVASQIPVLPAVLWLTTLALLAGHLLPRARTRGAMQLGNVALHLFFVVIGIHSRVAEIVEVGFEVFFLTLTVVGIHGVVVFGGGRLLRLDVGSLAVASQAAVGGPSTALAVAVSREWRALVLPGIAVGLLGYAVGNYLGIAVGHIVRGLGVGF